MYRCRLSLRYEGLHVTGRRRIMIGASRTDGRLIFSLPNPMRQSPIIVHFADNAFLVCPAPKFLDKVKFLILDTEPVFRE